MEKSVSSQSVLGVVLLISGMLAGCDGASNAADAPRAPSDSAALRNRIASANWPQWRGANQNGISLEIGWSANWPVGGPPIRWRSRVGVGFSSLAVVDGRIYTAGHEAGLAKASPSSPEEGLADNSHGERGLDTVWCLSAETGSVVWTHSYPCLLVDNLHEGGPAATPTVKENRVYTISKEGHLFCLDVDNGNVVWQRMLTDDLDVKMPEWGFSGSALVDGDLVVVDGGRVAAYHRLTGDLLWRTRDYKPGYGTPVSFDHLASNGQTVRLVAVLNNECLLVLRLTDGQEIARRRWTTQYDASAATPLVVGDTIFISTGYRRGCLLARLSGGRLKDVYENRDMCNHMNGCVLWDGYWYGINGSSHRSRTATLTCMEYGTGKVQWSRRGLGCGSVMVAGGKLVCLSDDGELVIVAPNPDKYHELGRTKILDGRCWTVPVLAGGHVYARNARGELVCVDLRESSVGGATTL